MIGQTISHYRIEEKLGEGGMGVVYKARDTKLDRTVALKFLPSQFGTDDEEKKRFINEAKAASALDHNNICSIYSIEETDGGDLFIVMAYYEGMSLKEKIEQGPLPLKDAVQYSIQIASGLQKAHEKDVIHRDLKPENLFITDDNQVKIIDFGLAKAAQRTMLTKSGTTLGTMPYMSPEQAQGSTVDHRTDIWSLGVVIYEMVTGQRPFKSEYDTALVYSIVNEDPEPVTGLRSGVPMELERIINKCLEKDSEERYQQTDDLIVDVRKVERELSSGVRSKAAISNQAEIPETSSADKDSSSGDRLVKHTIQPWMYGIPVIVILLLVLYFYLPDRTSPHEFDNSIAVLPFENMSPDPDDAFFADGVHDDIIIQLSQIGGIQPIARSSVIDYDVDNRNLQQIADELNVATVLEGNVRRAGDIVRVAVQLIDPQTNRTIWADSYERNISGVFEIQSEIAQEITSALRISLTPDERERLETQPTDVAEAYEYYVRGRDYFWRSPDEENIRASERLLQRAIEYDPDFAQAHALLSRVYSSLRWFGFDLSPENDELSRRKAERALQLEPDLPESHVAKGYYYYHGHRMYDEAMEHFTVARNLQPNNADVLSAIGWVKRRLGLFENSIEIIKEAIAIDPRNVRVIHNQAITYYMVREYEKANSKWEEVLSIAPDHNLARLNSALNRINWEGDTTSAHDIIQNFPHVRREHTTNRWLLLQFLIGDYEGIIRITGGIPEEVFLDHSFYMLPSSYYLGLVHEYSDETEKAAQYYEIALSVMKNLPSHYHEEPFYRMGLGKIYAGIGLAEQAMTEGEKALAIMSPEYDAYWNLHYREQMAIIYAQLEKPEEAVDILWDLLSSPSFVSVPKLKVDPFWNPIRETPEFQRLIQEFEDRV